MNAKKSGGSFYLQSKVFRALERIELELDTQIATEESKQTDNKQTDNSDT